MRSPGGRRRCGRVENRRGHCGRLGRQRGRLAPGGVPEPALGRSTAPARQFMGAGPADRPAVDAPAAAKGKVTWTASCASCHGADARGTEKGKNLIRSLMVLHKRNGSEIGPFLKKGHPAGAAPSATP